MINNSLPSEFLVKGSNLCSFLTKEKDEKLISQRLFSSICIFCEGAAGINNTGLSKGEIAILRKNISLEADKILLYLSSLYIAAFISAAQKESMLQTLDALKKELNI